MLGPKDGAAARLSVAQAFNSVAYIIAPTIGGLLIFGKRHEAGTPVDFSGLLAPYVVLGCVVLLVFGIFWFIKLPTIESGSGNQDVAEDASVHKAPLNRQPHFTWGIATRVVAPSI